MFWGGSKSLLDSFKRLGIFLFPFFSFISILEQKFLKLKSMYIWNIYHLSFEFWINFWNCLAVVFFSPFLKFWIRSCFIFLVAFLTRTSWNKKSCISPITKPFWPHRTQWYSRRIICRGAVHGSIPRPDSFTACLPLVSELFFICNYKWIKTISAKKNKTFFLCCQVCHTVCLHMVAQG